MSDKVFKQPSQENREDMETQRPLKPASEKPLKRYTEEIFDQIQNEKITLAKMTRQDLKKYLTGLKLYKIELTHHIDDVQKEIIEKKLAIKNRPTASQKAQNWWAAVGIIVLCLSSVITGGAFSISAVEQVTISWLRYILIAIIILACIALFVIIFMWVWPRRNIKYFEELIEDQEN